MGAIQEVCALSRYVHWKLTLRRSHEPTSSAAAKVPIDGSDLASTAGHIDPECVSAALSVMGFLVSTLVGNRMTKADENNVAIYNLKIARGRPGLSWSELQEHIRNHPIETPEPFLWDCIYDMYDCSQRLQEVKKSPIPCVEYYVATSAYGVEYNFSQSQPFSWNKTNHLNQTARLGPRYIRQSTTIEPPTLIGGLDRSTPTFGTVINGINKGRSSLRLISSWVLIVSLINECRASQSPLRKMVLV